MARTLWPIDSIVCLEDLPEFPYRLCMRVVEDHKSIIGIYNLLTGKIEWVFLNDLEYLDKPETIMEYYNAVQRENSKSIRRTKKPSSIHRDRSIEEPEWKQISGSQST
jgi:hypothetical protein